MPEFNDPNWDMEEIPALQDAEAWTAHFRRQRALKQAIDSIGSALVSGFNHINERLSKIMSQQDDLNNAEAQINQAITSLTTQVTNSTNNMSSLSGSLTAEIAALNAATQNNQPLDLSGLQQIATNLTNETNTLASANQTVAAQFPTSSSGTTSSESASGTVAAPAPSPSVSGGAAA